MDFSTVVLDTELSNILYRLAFREGRLSDEHAREYGERFSQRVGPKGALLPLLVLFDTVVVPGSNLDIVGVSGLGDLRIVIDRSIERVPARDVLGMGAGEVGPSVAELAGLASHVARHDRAFYVNDVAKTVSLTPFFKMAHRQWGITPRRFTNFLIELAEANQFGDTEAVYRTGASYGFDDAMVEECLEALYDHKHETDDTVDPIHMVFMFLFLSMQEMDSMLTASQRHNAAVATRRFRDSAAFRAVRNSNRDAISLEGSFRTVRSAIQEAGSFFPTIESIEDAVRLRKDANIVAFKRQLRLFHEHLAKGDEDSIIGLRSEVRKANEALRKVRRIEAVLRWVTYLSLPLTVVETITGLPPIGGLTLTVGSAAGTAVTDIAKQRHRWALLGR